MEVIITGQPYGGMSQVVKILQSLGVDSKEPDLRWLTADEIITLAHGEALIQVRRGLETCARDFVEANPELLTYHEAILFVARHEWRASQFYRFFEGRKLQIEYDDLDKSITRDRIVEFLRI